jgi:uncharacterized repeat protein (TIGR01451 family)
MLSVRNIGVLPADDVVVVDTLPAGTTFVSAPTGCAHAAGQVTCNVGTLAANDGAPGGPDEVLLTIEVTAPKVGEDVRIRNIAEVRSTSEPFANTGNNRDFEETVVLHQRPDLTLTKADEPDPIAAGDTLVYTLTVRNVGSAEGQNVIVEDTLPTGATFVSASPGCGETAGVVTCTVGMLAAGGEAVLDITVVAPPVTQDTVIKNIATVNADNELFSDTGNNLAIANTAVIAPDPDLSVTKTDSEDPVLRVREYSYVLTVTNGGGGDAKDVTLTDELPVTVLPNGVEQPVVFLDAKGADCAADETTVTCNIPLVEANGGEVVVVLNVRAPTVVVDKVVTNQASVTDADEPSDPPGNNSATEETTILACFDVTGDGGVFGPDITDVVAAFGAVEGDDNYDLLLDIDDKGAITGSDIAKVVEQFGIVCG